MVITLLAVTFLVAFAVCYLVARIFRPPVDKILQRLVADEIYVNWTKYITFAIYVVGLSGGVRVWDMEKYINPQSQPGSVLMLTAERWVLEIYRTVIGTLQGIAWMLLIFFLFSLIAYVIVKGMELKKQRAG